MGTNYAFMVANLILFSLDMDFIISHSNNKQAYFIDAFNTAFKYLRCFNIGIYTEGL